jgi:hypothetical protein
MDYFFDYNASFEEFLNEKGIKNVTGESDIMCVTLVAHNDSPMMATIMEFMKWYRDNEHDMSINPSGSGSMYHKG